jgi:hypothetical protein
MNNYSVRYPRFRTIFGIANTLAILGFSSSVLAVTIVSTNAEQRDDRRTDLAARVRALETDLTRAIAIIDDLQSMVSSQQATLAILQSQVSTVNNSQVMALNAYLNVSAVGGSPKATFSGINLQLVNGTGKTDSPNGLGNLIIGYDTVRNDGVFRCSYGGYRYQTSCEGTGNTWAVSHKSGSHYLVIGDENNYSQFGGLIVGLRNTGNMEYSSVSGGYSNTADGTYSSVSGGYFNTASGGASSVTGGEFNSANGPGSSVSGGSFNDASAEHSSILGGSHQSVFVRMDTIPALP